MSFWHAILSPCLVIMASARTEACPVCVSMPTQTAADYVIGSESIVFVRENPDKPFSYRPVEVLKGDEFARNIDLFVDSNTRRRLKANPNQVVVLVRESKDKPWKSLGIANDDYKKVIRRVMVFANEWAGKNGRTKRCEYFLSLFGHENQAIFELAYLELGRAPYSMIKRVARSISSDNLHPMLQKREYIDWRPLAILMLAQNADEQDRRFIEDSFQGCQKFSLTTNLAAWTTAYIELNGTSAVETIKEKYFSDTKRTEAEIRAVITALSIHGREGHVHLRDRIARSYGIALKIHPEVTGLIVNDLMNWKKWEYREDVAKLLTQSNISFKISEAKAIRSYLK